MLSFTIFKNQIVKALITKGFFKVSFVIFLQNILVNIYKRHYYVNGNINKFYMEVIHMTSDFSIAVHALVYLGKNQDLISSDELAKHICTHPVRVRRVMIKLREAGLIKAKAGVDGGYRLDKEADNITLSEIAKSVSNDYIHVTWHNGEDGREAIKDSKVEQAIDSIFVDLNEACDNLLKDKTIEDIMNISK